MSMREALLDLAATRVAERADEYGDAEDCFDAIAAMWSAYLGIEIEPRDVASMMVLLKVARIKGGKHFDNWVDIAGYAACGAEVEYGQDMDG